MRVRDDREGMPVCGGEEGTSDGGGGNVCVWNGCVCGWGRGKCVWDEREGMGVSVRGREVESVHVWDVGEGMGVSVRGEGRGE